MNELHEFATLGERKNADLAGFMRGWLEKNSAEPIKQSTRALYSQIIERHLVPALGKFEICALSPDDVHNYARNKLAFGRLDGRGGLCEKTVREQLVLLCTILDAAVAARLCASNPARLVKLPRATQKPPRVFSAAEQKSLERAILQSEDISCLGIVVCLYTGLRIGELCALKWENVDFELATITVQHTLLRIQKPTATSRTQVILDTPKSRSSARTIPLSPALLQKLRRYFKLLDASVKSPQDFVFTQRAGFIEPRLFEKRFSQILQRAGIKRANFHALRHTFATRCMEFNMDIKSLSEILGHSDVTITLNRYVHSFMEQKRRELQKLDKIMAV